MNRLKLRIQPEIDLALSKKQPVVALESTLITHGFARPGNLNIAREIEQTVREEGAIPATIAILAGEIAVGLTDDQLTYLSEVEAVRKCSVRDLPIVMTQKGHGSTTVAATMVIAHHVGIQLFVTGGLGGVHRGSNWDVSADLLELGRTPLTVVCAGMKAFLDLPATLEYLETQAVPVLGYGVNELPAFYSRSSGLSVDVQVDTPQAVADLIRVRDALGLRNTILLTNPVPQADEWPFDEAQIVIDQAQAEANNLGITGKDITPFMLSRIAELSAGSSKRANISLLLNNARLGAAVAVALAETANGSLNRTKT